MLAQVERNDAYLKADFLTKRGQHPVVGATASPPRDFNFDSCSAVLGCFCKVLAVAKVRAIHGRPCMAPAPEAQLYLHHNSSMVKLHSAEYLCVTWVCAVYINF